MHTRTGERLRVLAAILPSLLAASCSGPHARGWGSEAGEIHRAAYAGDIPRIRAAIAAGESPSERVYVPVWDLKISRLYETPLSLAIRGDREVAVRELLATGAVADARDLRLASSQGPEMLEVLFQSGVPVDTRLDDARGGTLLHSAVGDEERVAFLLKHGADPGARDDDGRTALMNMDRWWSDYSVSARLLLEAGADVNALDNEGNAPISFAWGARPAELIALLVSAGANVNHRNQRGRTPLHEAAGRAAIETSFPSSIERARALLNAGADPTVKSNKGQTAADLARIQKNQALAELLERAVADRSGAR